MTEEQIRARLKRYQLSVLAEAVTITAKRLRALRGGSTPTFGEAMLLIGVFQRWEAE